MGAISGCSRTVKVNTCMQFYLKTKNGPQNVTSRGINKRYRAVANESTTQADITQFKTYMRYEFHLDYDPVSQIFGASEYQMRKIRSRWGDKFTFNIPKN